MTGLGIRTQESPGRRKTLTEGGEVRRVAGGTVVSIHIAPNREAAMDSVPEARAVAGLVHRGGLRASILTDGVIRTGDTVRVLAGPAGGPTDGPALGARRQDH